MEYSTFIEKRAAGGAIAATVAGLGNAVSSLGSMFATGSGGAIILASSLITLGSLGVGWGLSKATAHNQSTVESAQKDYQLQKLRADNDYLRTSIRNEAEDILARKARTDQKANFLR